MTTGQSGAPDGPARPPEGCLTVALRLPVRIVVLVLVLPVRMAWDALRVAGRLLRREVLVPLGRALAWLWRVLVVIPVGVLIVTPAVWLYRNVLAPLGRGTVWAVRRIGAGVVWLARGLGAGVAWAWRVLVVVPVGWAYARVLTSVGHAVVWAARQVGAAVAWLVRVVVVVPARWFGTRVLVPFGRALARGLRRCRAGWGRLAAGCVRLARTVGLGIGWAARGVGTALVWLVKLLLVWPLGALWRYVLVPAAGAVRWLGKVLVVAPATALWRWVLVPVGRVVAALAREVADAFGHAWRIAGHLSRAVGRGIAWCAARLWAGLVWLGLGVRRLAWVLTAPLRWIHRAVLAPVGHLVRDALWRPAVRVLKETAGGVRQSVRAARASVRAAGADVRRALWGTAPPRHETPPRETSAPPGGRREPSVRLSKTPVPLPSRPPGNGSPEET